MAEVNTYDFGGPGAPPQPWIVGTNSIAYNGALLVPSTVPGGNTGLGTINTNDLFLKGVSIENYLNNNYLPLGGGTLSGPLYIPGIANLHLADGLAGQLATADGRGNLVWSTLTNVGLPGGGQAGYVLATDGNVNFYWTSNLPGGPYLPLSAGPFLPLNGGTIGGPISGPLATFTTLNISGPVETTRSIFGQTIGSNRWELQLGDDVNEPGDNSGSNFKLVSYDDTGAFLSVPLTVDRLTGDAIFDGSINVLDNGAINLTCAPGLTRDIIGQTNTIDRWIIQLGDGSAETGGNLGSNFIISRCNDLGHFIDSPISINRSNALVTLSGGLGAYGAGTFGGSLSAVALVSITETAPNANAFVGFFNNTATRIGYVGLFNENLYLNHDSTGYRLVISSSGLAITGPTNIAGALVTTGALTTGGGATINGNLAASGFLTTSGYIACNPSVACYSVGGDSGIYCYDQGQVLRAEIGWQATTGNAILYNPRSGGLLSINPSAQLVYNGNAFKPGGGAWLDTSDIRIKTLHSEYKSGLKEIAELVPRNFRFKGNDTQTKDSVSVHAMQAKEETIFTGLVADEVMRVMPDMVKFTRGFIDGKEVDDLKTLDTTYLTYAFINAFKEIAIRLKALEKRAGYNG
jgi:hypothetical protein